MINHLAGIVVLVAVGLAILTEWVGGVGFTYAAAACLVVFLALVMRDVIWSRRIFVAIAVALVVAAVATRTDWADLLTTAFRSAAFIAAFFLALATLRNASTTSPAIETCGRFLAEQPPGRRYLALTVGGHLFGLILNYGAIALLGGLAEANARRESNDEIRRIRLRRMLLAIQRGVISTLSWSPLAFAAAISTALVPGARWADAAPPALVTSLILAGMGWALDTVFKPRLTTPAAPRVRAIGAEPTGNWASMLPLLVLLTVIIATVGSLHVLTGIRAVGVVMVVVPLLSILWIGVQERRRSPVVAVLRRIHGYVTRDVPAYRSELVLLTMAGFIGVLGSRLMSPLVAAAGLDLGALPGWMVLVGVVWVVPLASLIGMNPILSVSLIAPLLPPAEVLGITPAAIIVALTGGWALSGAISPYTATTLMVGRIADTNAWHVGLRWNGLYALLSCTLVSIWAVLYGELF